MVEITHAQGFSECKKDSMPKKCLLRNFLLDKKLKPEQKVVDVS